MNSKYPYALLDYNGKVLWVNEKFTEITGKTKNFHKSITSIFPGITRELIQQEQFVEDVNMVWQEHNFRIEMSKIYFEEMAENSSIVSIEEDEQYLTALYLFDETELYNYIRENEEQKLVAGLVYIDNYDEALDSIEDVKRSLLVALIDRKVNQYFTKMDALVRKIEKDKYFVVFQHKYLAELQSDPGSA